MPGTKASPLTSVITIPQKNFKRTSNDKVKNKIDTAKETISKLEKKSQIRENYL